MNTPTYTATVHVLEASMRVIATLFVLALAVGCSEESAPEPKAVQTESPVIALTPTEYNNTVRDLLGMPTKGLQWPDLPPQLKALIPSSGPRKGIFGIAPPKTAPWPWRFPTEAGINGFEGMAKGQTASPYLVEELNKAATQYAAYALLSPIFLACEATVWNLPKDDKTTAARKACGEKSIVRFTQRAYRRPLSAEERTRLTAFWTKNWSEGTPEEAVVLTLAGVLQSPSFLFRPEEGLTDAAVGKVAPLSSWEMASRLSYFLWDSMPDGELFAAAANDALATSEQVEAQATRMLQDPRARRAVVRFHSQWLGLQRIYGISPARRVYGPLYGVTPSPPLDTTGDAQWPAILNPARHSMKAETELFFEQAVFEGEGTLQQLFSGNKGYVSDVTAPIYGVGTCPSGVGYPGGGPGKGGKPCTFDETKVDTSAEKAIDVDFGMVAAVYISTGLKLHPATFPADQRSGILTLPSMLAIGAHPVHPSPILRGTTILERVMCQHLGTPPPTAEAGAPPDTETAESTNRERTEQSTASPACSGCHNQINPPGMAFEHYDSFGQWRAKDNGKQVDASGKMDIVGEGTITFTDAVDLSKQLAKSARVHDCYVQHWVRYAVGVSVKTKHPVLAELQQKFRTTPNIKKLLVSIVGSDLFRFRRAGGK